MSALRIERAAEPNVDVRALVGELEATLAAAYPPEQRHGLAIDALFVPNVRFYLAYQDVVPVGCCGIAFDEGFAEVKRMYVRSAVRGQGIADALLARVEDDALVAGYALARLETGIHQRAAIRFYERNGYRRCAAFGAYLAMPPHAIATSVFMEKSLV